MDLGHHVRSMNAVRAAFRYTLSRDPAELTIGTRVPVAASSGGSASFAGMLRPPAPLLVLRGASAARQRGELTV